MMYADAVAKAMAGAPPFELEYESIRYPFTLLAAPFHNTPLAGERPSAALAQGGQIYKMVRKKTDELVLLKTLGQSNFLGAEAEAKKAQHRHEAQRMRLHYEVLPVKLEGKMGGRGERWEKVMRMVMRGEGVSASAVAYQLNEIGFVIALTSDCVLSKGWHTCPACRQIPRYDARHEMFECHGGATHETLTQMADCVQKVIDKLQPGFEGEGDTETRDYNQKDRQLLRALRSTVQTLRWELEVRRGTEGGERNWEVCRDTLGGYLPSPGPATAAHIKKLNEEASKEDKTEDATEKFVVACLMEAATLGAGVLNEGISRRGSGRKVSDANLLSKFGGEEVSEDEDEELCGGVGVEGDSGEEGEGGDGGD